MASEKLLLIDSHALIHRAYHGITTDLTSPSGEPTKAVYGYINTILKIVKDTEPRYIIATFDAGKSFRSTHYTEYKATRAPLTDDLRGQIKRSREFCEAFGMPVYAEPGYEADDLIGTLSEQAEAQGIETVILTGDTDTLQLVDGKTNVLMFVGRSNEMLLYDQPKVEERYTLKPLQLIDLKALRGDNSDNIPGIPGVGDKTATRLLQDFGSVERIYEHVDEIDAKTRAKLEPAQAQVLLNKQLVTIERHAPVTLDLDAAEWSGYNREKVVELFRLLGMQSLVNRLPETSRAPAPVQKSAVSYHAVLGDAELDALAKKIKKAKAFSVDTETTGLDPLRSALVGISIGMGDGEAYYIPVGHTATFTPPPVSKTPAKRTAREIAQPSLFEGSPETLVAEATELVPSFPQLPIEQVVKKLGPLFADPKIAKYGHNASYDWEVLERAGFTFKGLAFDTMIAAHLVETGGQKIGLKDLAFSKFGAQMTEIESLIGKGKGQLSMAQVGIEKIVEYASADADFTYRLYELYKPELEARGLDKLFYDLEMPLVPVIVDLERAGVMLDLPLLAKLSEEITAKMGELETEIYAMVGMTFNLGSPVQLSDALFGKLGLSSQGLERTSTGKISTAAGVLEGLKDQHPVIPLILQHRELAKLKGTYVDALPELINPDDGRVHTNFNQAGAVTGRLSSSTPNLQNIPVRTELGRRVRRAFIADKGNVLMSADYSQVELRILAHASQDENMLKAFADGEDIHMSTAALLFNVPIDQVTKDMRRLGKTINFGVVYGISDWGVAGRTELSLEESRKLITSYYEKYPGVRAYMERTKELARTQGYVESLMGRRRYFPELMGGGSLPIGRRNQIEREAINMPIQASAADIIKIAMVRLHAALLDKNLKSRMILQVHDELVLECPKPEVKIVAPLVREIMQNAYQLATPLGVEVRTGPNWDEMTLVADNDH